MTSVLRSALRHGSRRTSVLSNVFARDTPTRVPHGLAATVVHPRRFFAGKPRRGLGPQGTAGLIAIKDPSLKLKKRKKSQPIICSGCGTQVVSGGEGDGSLFNTGADAVNSELSKKAAKKARYADLGDFSNDYLCKRCKALKKNDIWSAYDAIKDVDAAIFVKQLHHIVSRRKYGLCIIVADATDPEHSAPKNVRRSIGNLPVILVLTKCDLLPRMWSREIRTISSKVRDVVDLRFDKTFAVSAHTGSGMFALAEYLLLNLRGRDVFCVGAANVGKSSLVKSLAETITPNIYLKGQAHRAQKRKKALNNLSVTASNLPGTTLQAVRVPCFPSDRHALWDTPGIIQRKAVQYNLFAPHLMEPLTRAEPIRLVDRMYAPAGSSIVIEAAWMDSKDSSVPDNTGRDDNEETRLPLVSEACVLARVDIVSVEGGRSILFRPYLHPSLRVRIVPTDLAPSTATIPTHHIEHVQSRMGKAFSDDVVTSRPLAVYEQPENPEGHLIPTDKEKDSFGERIYMDLSFASLGWLSMTHYDTFCLRPWCIEGSVYSKRPAVYPFNLAEKDVEEQRLRWAEEIEYLHSDEARRSLHESAREGRRNSGLPRTEEKHHGDFDFGEDEWYI